MPVISSASPSRSYPSIQLYSPGNMEFVHRLPKPRSVGNFWVPHELAGHGRTMPVVFNWYHFGCLEMMLRTTESIQKGLNQERNKLLFPGSCFSVMYSFHLSSSLFKRWPLSPETLTTVTSHKSQDDQELSFYVWVYVTSGWVVGW